MLFGLGKIVVILCLAVFSRIYSIYQRLTTCAQPYGFNLFIERCWIQDVKRFWSNELNDVESTFFSCAHQHLIFRIYVRYIVSFEKQ